MMVKHTDLEKLKATLLQPQPEEASFVVASELSSNPHRFWVGEDFLGHVALITVVAANFGSHSSHAEAIAEATEAYISQDERDENENRSKVVIRATNLKDNNDLSVHDRDSSRSPLTPLSQLISAFKTKGYEHGVPAGSALSNPILQQGVRAEHINEINISDGLQAGGQTKLETEPYFTLGKTAGNAKEGLAYTKDDILKYYMLNLVMTSQVNLAKLLGVDRFRVPSGSAYVLHEEENGDMNWKRLIGGPKPNTKN